VVGNMPFDPGYVRRPYISLVENYPGDDVYPPDSFRTEWGPIFHRGRLDGTAGILVIGQDPATHESICRRILVGEAGQRLQGLLAKMGITRSYVLINTFLYSVYGQSGGTKHIDDPGIGDYRNSWINAIVTKNDIQAIIALGQLADQAYRSWKATPEGTGNQAAYAAVTHPTYPESASRSGSITKAEAFKRLCASWNAALTQFDGHLTQDEPTPLVLYGDTLAKTDLATIPQIDLPPGLPPWMRALDAWAVRTGADTQTKRATITVTIPRNARTWPPIA
jgi:hypothetical protein